MCLFSSTKITASPSWSRLLFSSSSLVAIAEPILSNTFQFSQYSFLFPWNLNCGSDSFGFSCFQRLAASRSRMILFNSVLYCFCCSSNSFAQLGGSCVIFTCSRVELELPFYRTVARSLAVTWVCVIPFKTSGSSRTRTRTHFVFCH